MGTKTQLLAPTVMRSSAVLTKVMTVSPFNKPDTLLTVMASCPCFAMSRAFCVAASPVNAA